jgi:hypothetical protein
MTTFDLTVYVTGLAMFVPDENAKQPAMHVLFPDAKGHGKQHLMRFAFPVDCARNLPSGVGNRFPWSVPMVEVDGHQTHTEFMSSAQKPDLDTHLDGRAFAKLTDYSKKKVDRGLLQGKTHPKLSASLTFRHGKVAGTLLYDWIGWEFAEKPWHIRQMTNGACWHIPEVTAPLKLTIPEMKDPLELAPPVGKTAMTLIVAHAPEGEIPSRWSGSKLPDPKDFPMPYSPDHFHAFHGLVGEHKPNPWLRLIGDLTQTLPEPKRPCDGLNIFGEVYTRGIHPVTCIITGGDPDPEGR